MCVAILFRNHRSWEMTKAQPFQESKASSKARKVATSKSFVGSSSKRQLPPEVNTRASWRRLRSPPERSPTFFCWSEDLKLYQEQYARELTALPPKLTSSAPPVSSSKTDFDGSKESRDWSTYISFTVSPTAHDPASGLSSPTIIRKRVVLPAPFPPTIPTIDPGGIVAVKLSMSNPLVSKPFVKPSHVKTTSPKRGAVGMVIESIPSRLVYSAEAAHNSSYALKRAFPFFCCPFAFLRTHSNSCFNALSMLEAFLSSMSNLFAFDSNQVV
mmetsp:Transcript_5668/g.19080  ORF Transcript_5668/g.19080 Transcript_5668/m.19080 type:complete len:271 (-) Transcript_5668:1128-1940(-)